MRAPIFRKIPEIVGAALIELDSFQDERGINGEIWTVPSVTTWEWNLDSYSVSKKNVLRGAHFDDSNDKLIQILFGRVQFVMIDVRENSDTFGNVKEIILDYTRPTQIFVPKNVANAHLCLSDNCVFYYKWNLGYKPQKCIKWNDPKYNIKWLCAEPILSERDK